MPREGGPSTMKSSNHPLAGQTRSKRRLVIAVLSTVLLVGGIVGYLLYCRPWEAQAAQNSATGENTYTCPMHPQVLQEGPGICPICFMDLVPKTVKAKPSANGHEGHDLSADAVALSERGRVIADVATTTIVTRPLSTTVTASAGVDYNEATHRIITARFAGRVERLFVDRTGQYVAKGSPLMEVYSPELVTAQQEYLIARETPQLELTATATGSTTETRGNRMVRSARRRLELLGMSAGQISALEQRGEIAYTTTVFAPFSGLVVRRDVTEGGYLGLGAPIVELVDLGTVYVIANVNESQAWKVRLGQPITISGPALGIDEITSRVEYIYPAVDAASRTVRVRAVVSNPGTRLKPGMFVTARISVPGGEAAVVPADAVVRTGKRDLVYVEVGRNMFEPRDIKLGVRDGEYYQVVGGAVKAGDRIVSEGGYLLDAERRLQAPGANDPHAGHGSEATQSAGTAQPSSTSSPTNDPHAGH
jgi:Cu(I)/Ag(I) efflux system membrane fusion protein